MRDELTNLLPPERRATLARDYYLRLATVAAILVAALAAVAAALLAPTYIYLVTSAQAKAARLAEVNATLSSADDATLSAQLAALNADAAALLRLDDAPTVSAVMRTALAVPHAGVSLTGFTYAQSQKKATLAITGIASTRDALRTYQIALENVPLFTAADLPVSAYAQDTNSAFTVTLMIASSTRPSP